MVAHNNFPIGQMLPASEFDTLRLPTTETFFDGTYYQPEDEAACSARYEALRSKVATGDSRHITLGEYQRWVELNWLTPHGTYQTAQRVTQKLVEEGATEYLNEIAQLPARSQDADSSQSTAKSIDEMGDVAWTLVANASNLGIDLEAAVSRKFATTEPVTMEHLQQLIETSPLWVPLWTQADIEEVGTVFADTDELDPHPLIPLMTYQIMAQTAAAFQFGRASTPAMTPELLGATADLHVDALMIYGYYTAQWSRSDLATVVSGNFAKITDRVATNKLDKSAGNR